MYHDILRHMIIILRYSTATAKLSKFCVFHSLKYSVRIVNSSGILQTDRSWIIALRRYTPLRQYSPRMITHSVQTFNHSVHSVRFTYRIHCTGNAEDRKTRDIPIVNSVNLFSSSLYAGQSIVTQDIFGVFVYSET